MSRNRRHIAGRVLTVGAGVLAVAAFWCNALAASFVCEAENSVCATRRVRDTVYSGRFADVTRPAAVDVVVLERSDDPHRIATDSRGRFCFVYAEGASPSASIVGGPTTILRSRRLPRGASPPSRCPPIHASIAWNHSRELRSTWQYISILVVSAVAVLALAGAHAVGGRRARLLRGAGVATGIAAAVLCVLLWTVAA
jgi:hypothetical protein